MAIYNVNPGDLAANPALVDDLSAGDTLHFRAGTHYGNKSVNSNPIRQCSLHINKSITVTADVGAILTYHPTNPALFFATPDGDWSNGPVVQIGPGVDVSLTGLHIIGPLALPHGSEDPPDRDDCIVLDNDVGDVIIADCLIEQAGHCGIKTYRRDGLLTVERCWFENNGRETRDHAIYMSQGNAEMTIIRHCVALNSTGAGYLIFNVGGDYPQNVLIHDCIAADNARPGIIAGGAGMQIYNNALLDNRLGQLQLWNEASGTIRHNIMSDFGITPGAPALRGAPSNIQNNWTIEDNLYTTVDMITTEWEDQIALDNTLATSENLAFKGSTGMDRFKIFASPLTVTPLANLTHLRERLPGENLHTTSDLFAVDGFSPYPGVFINHSVKYIVLRQLDATYWSAISNATVNERGQTLAKGQPAFNRQATTIGDYLILNGLYNDYEASIECWRALLAEISEDTVAITANGDQWLLSIDDTDHVEIGVFDTAEDARGYFLS